MTRPVQTVTSELLSELPVIPAPVGDLLLAGLDLTPRRRVPAWVTDPGLIADIVAGFVDIPDELLGGRPVTVDQQWPAWTLVAATAALSIALLRLGRHLTRPAGGNR